MGNLLLIFTVAFVVTIAAACGVGVLVMLGSVQDVEKPPRRKRKAGDRAAGTHPVFRDLR